MLNGGLNKTNSGYANVSENKLECISTCVPNNGNFSHFSTDIMNISIIIYTIKYINMSLILAILKRPDLHRNLY